MAHSPTGHGVLHRGDRAKGPTTYAGLRSALSDVADSHDATPGQVALAWVHHRPQSWGLAVVPLPGTTSLGHLRVNIAAADLTLSTAELSRLDAASVPAVGTPL